MSPKTSFYMSRDQESLDLSLKDTTATAPGRAALHRVPEDCPKGGSGGGSSQQTRPPVHEPEYGPPALIYGTVAITPRAHTEDTIKGASNSELLLAFKGRRNTPSPLFASNASSASRGTEPSHAKRRQLRTRAEAKPSELARQPAQSISGALLSAPRSLFPALRPPPPQIC